MRLVAHRAFRPHEELTQKARQFYRRMGISESFLSDIKYSGPHEAAWAFAARGIMGRRYSKKMRAALDDAGIEADFEERAKRLKRIAEKLTRDNRSPGLDASFLARLLDSARLPAPKYPVGSIRDMFGIRVIIPSSGTSRDDCYDVLDIVLKAAAVTEQSQLLSMVDYLAYPEHRFSPDGEYLGRYESLQVSFIHLGVPIEVQIRDNEMDWKAKNCIKRNGLD